MKTRPLVGLKSLAAFNAFHALMLGLKMLPEYMAVSYEDFFAALEQMDDAGKMKMIRKAATFVKLDPAEVEAMVCFAEDKNGVAFGPENMKAMGPAEYVDLITLVAFEISKIRIDFVTEGEKKN